jgi:hypothetical protein
MCGASWVLSPLVRDACQLQHELNSMQQDPQGRPHDRTSSADGITAGAHLKEPGQGAALHIASAEGDNPNRKKSKLSVLRCRDGPATAATVLGIQLLCFCAQHTSMSRSRLAAYWVVWGTQMRCCRCSWSWEATEGGGQR